MNYIIKVTKKVYINKTIKFECIDITLNINYISLFLFLLDFISESTQNYRILKIKF